MLSFSIACFLLLAVLLVRSFWWTFRLTGLYRRCRPCGSVDENLPRVAVLLPVRGADPFLVDCVRGLARQDHPNHDVHVIVDHRQDPAWEVVAGVIESEGCEHVHVSHIRDVLQTCTPRHSGLLQVLRELDADVEAIVIIDADVIPHPEWLRQLVAPLLDERVGATTGIRWFMPGSTEWGTLVRYLWNAGAVPEMNAFRIMWGGSLAIKTEVLRESGFADRWAKCLFEDTHTYQMVRSVNREVRFVPQVTMVNREAISLQRCIPYLRR